MPTSPSLLHPPAMASSAAPPPSREGESHAGPAPPPHPFAGICSGGAPNQAGPSPVSSSSASSSAAPWLQSTAAADMTRGLPLGLTAGACGGASGANPPLNNALVNHPLLQVWVWEESLYRKYTQYFSSGTPGNFLYQCPTYTKTDIHTNGHTTYPRSF